MKRMKRLQSILTVFFVLIRLLLAFACGWFLSFLIAKIDTSALGLTPLLFVGFPPTLGILAATLTVRRRNPYLIPLSIGTGLLVVVGIFEYWLPLALQKDAEMDALCATDHCHVWRGVETGLLNFFLFYGIVVVLLGAVITGRVIKRNLKGETFYHLPENTNTK